MPDLTLLAQLLINGLILGAIYALISVGLSLIFGVLGIANIAHGELYMLGGYALFFLMETSTLGFWTSLPVVVAALGVFGYLLYRTLLSRTEGQESLERGLLVTIGVSMVLQNGMIYILDAQPRIVSTPYAFNNFQLMGLRLPQQRLFAVLVAIFSLSVLYLLLTRTRLGKAMRAVTQNRDAALAVGIQPGLVSALTVTIGASMAGVGGAIVAPMWGIHPTMGLPILFKSFAIIVVGGLGSIPGAAIAAILIGLVESFAGGLVSIVLQDAAAFILMIVVLFVRPQGILGKRVRL